jgi:uncharacterized lipoprotein NlpE involved in copper resistance
MRLLHSLLLSASSLALIACDSKSDKTHITTKSKEPVPANTAALEHSNSFKPITVEELLELTNSSYFKILPPDGISKYFWIELIQTDSTGKETSLSNMSGKKASGAATLVITKRKDGFDYYLSQGTSSISGSRQPGLNSSSHLNRPQYYESDDTLYTLHGKNGEFLKYSIRYTAASDSLYDVDYVPQKGDYLPK